MSSPLQPESEKDDKLDDYEDMTVKGKSPLYQEIYKMLYAAQTGHVTISIGTKDLVKYIQANYISKAAVREAIVASREKAYSVDWDIEPSYYTGIDSMENELLERLGLDE